ncbi:MAG: hypothetical protein M8354_09615, partial [Halalkalicoccus sp.]|nr:hypothetical protein [Halalkalicoccus sp.]
MVVIVLFTLVGASFTDVSTRLGNVAVELRARCTELSARRGDCDHVAAESQALFHLLALTDALVGAMGAG